MKLPELWEPFTKGQWISRKAWKANYAIALCNLNEGVRFPILAHDTYGYLYHFGQIPIPKSVRKPDEKHLVHGLQYDLLAEDWFLADQTQCVITLKERD